MRKNLQFFIVAICLADFAAVAQHEHHQEINVQRVRTEAQPLLAQALRLDEALGFLGSALAEPDSRKLRLLDRQPLTEETVQNIQKILDPYCLNHIHINPESRVSVERGAAPARLIQGGWTSFLVKVHNGAGVTARLEVQSPNSVKPFHSPSFEPRVKDEFRLTQGQVSNRFLEIAMYRGRPLLPALSGLGLEYAVVQIYSKDAGAREAELSFNVGQGSQDIGFRNAISILFDIRPSAKVNLRIKDDDGSSTMASLRISDDVERVSGKLGSIYPLPSRRIAAYDEYPDFFFQPQIYRADGEHVNLASGSYRVNFSRGPEYIPQNKMIEIAPGMDSLEVEFRLKRWIDMRKLGWYSADHHVHAAGCSHYDSPEEGVKPEDMWRQARGEDLNVAAVLTWGPSWYHQKKHFSGKDEPFSANGNIMRYDVEVSGFPSSHAGHLVLLGVKEDDYPGTKEIEQWPSWTFPVLSWAKGQDALTGYAHSGWGLQPVTPTQKLPNFVLPKMDGIGANEYVVTVTEKLVDFYSAGDTPAPWELNMYYHSLNCGFRTRLSGETDFPCITDARVGQARSYYKPDGANSYDSYIRAIRNGRSYVSDGKSHLMDFAVNGREVGVGKSVLNLKSKQAIQITSRVAAYLPEEQDIQGKLTASKALDEKPYWDIERARKAQTRKVRVELIVNGESVDTTEVLADGKIQDVKFSYDLGRSAWVALRIYPSSHTNPFFVELDDQPILVKSSAEWCLSAVEQCWKMKSGKIRSLERADAEQVYKKASAFYRRLIKEK